MISLLYNIYHIYAIQKELKKFLTHIGSIVPLTVDPPIRAEKVGRKERPVKIEC
jgi:hypothetical protein